jgi:glutaredoxin-like YruB-family protein
MSHTVIVFTTPTCGWCHKLKSFLRENHVSFKEIDVSRDTRAADDMFRKSGQMGVPQTWIDNKPVIGFDRPKLERLLGIGGNHGN